MLLFLAICLTHIIAGFITSAIFLRPANRTEHILLAGLTAWFTFYLVPIAIGWTSGFMNGYILGTGVLAGVSLAVAGISRGHKDRWIIWKFDSVKHRPLIEWGIWIAMAILLLLLLLVGMALPVRAIDAPAYHMSNPMRWHQSGKFILDSFGGLDLGPQLLSAECAPNMKAVLPYAILLFTKDTPATALAQYPFLLLLIFAVRATALRIGAKGWLASLASAITIVVPEIFLQSLEAYSDLAFLAGQMVLVWALVYFWQSRVSWQSILYPAIGFAVLSGSKAAFLSAGGLGGLLYGVLLLWRLLPQKRWYTVYWIGAALVFVLAGILFSGGPWLLHAWREFGSPVFPYAVKVGELTILEGPMSSDINRGMVKAFTGESGAAAYFNTLREFWRPNALSSWAGGLGASMFMVGIPALILFLLATVASGKMAGSRRVFGAAFLLYMAANPTLAIARFSLFQPVMGLIAFAWLASIIPFSLRMISVLLAVAAAGYDLFITLPSITYRPRPPSLVGFNLLSGHSRAALMGNFPDQYSAMDYWREEISQPGTRLALHSSNVAVWFAYAPWSPSDLLRFRDPANASDMEQWHNEMLQAGVTHLYLQKTDPGFVLAITRPDLFPVLMRRLDSHFSLNLNDYGVTPWPEDALFSVAGAGKS